ncbi:MAG: amidohydrolase family protein [Candidatus Kariarchaeaceae archaeon]|jgi:imidazolonepropionase-like amidohydrolase
MDRLVFNQATYFDAVKGSFVENQAIVVEGKKITWIGDSSAFEKEEQDKIVNVEKQFLIPGLMDIHIHLSVDFSWTVQPEKTVLRRKDGYISYLALKHAQTYLKYGFTTVRDCGSRKSNWPSSLRSALNEAMFSGPRVFVAQNPIRQWGDQESFGPEDWIKIERKNEVKSGVDGVIHAVRERKRMGSDFIKTMTTGGVLHGIESKVQRSLWRDEELQAMTSEAERLGMYVAAHAHGELGIHNAIENGVRTIEHGSLITEESAKLLVKKEGFLIPTQSAPDLLKDPEVKANLNPEVIEKGEYVSKLAIERHKVAFELGVQFALGTDAPVGDDHCHSGRELEKMVTQVGMSPVQAIQCASINAARAMKQEDQIGSIETGKLADIVVLNVNPLDNIAVFTDSKNISEVYKDGRLVSSDGKIIV